MTANTLWRVLVTLVCAGAIMALPQGSTARDDLAKSGASAPESWFKAGDQTPASPRTRMGTARADATVLMD